MIGGEYSRSVHGFGKRKIKIDRLRDAPPRMAPDTPPNLNEPRIPRDPEAEYSFEARCDLFKVGRIY